MKERLRTALSQFDIVWEDKKANYKKAKKMAEQASAAGADLLIFPEMSFTGFSMNTSRNAERSPYDTVAAMKTVSEAFPQMTIAFGYAGYGEGPLSDQVFNFLEVVQGGKSLMRYKKIHPFTFGEEGKHFSGGSDLASFSLGAFRISGFICYDLRFPEIFQISSRESGFIFVIANWPEERAAHWKLLLQARAVENQCYVAGVNRIGAGGGLRYEPGSMAFDPSGNLLEGQFYGTGCGDEGFSLVEIDAGEVERVRKNFPLKADRREKLYAEWYTKVREV